MSRETAPTRLRAKVSHDLCVGVGMCLVLAPGSFRRDADGRSTFAEASDGDASALREAADDCPMSAITLLGGED